VSCRVVDEKRRKQKGCCVSLVYQVQVIQYSHKLVIGNKVIGNRTAVGCFSLAGWLQRWLAFRRPRYCLAIVVTTHLHFVAHLILAGGLLASCGHHNYGCFSFLAACPRLAIDSAGTVCSYWNTTWVYMCVRVCAIKQVSRLTSMRFGMGDRKKKRTVQRTQARRRRRGGCRPD